MTLKEFQEHGDCSDCPFMKEKECPGGWTSGAGGEPIEPPCCCWPDDPDIDMEDLIRDYYVKQNAYEEYLDEIYLAEKERKEKAARRAETRKSMESYCISERAKVKVLKKKLKALNKQADLARCWASAFNFANDVFQYKERYQINPVLDLQIKTVSSELEEAEAAYKNKRKEFYAKRKSEKSGK